MFSGVDDREEKGEDAVNGGGSIPRSSPNIGWPMSEGQRDDAEGSVNESTSSIISKFYSLLYDGEKKGEKL
jgi:hypothetical protein